LSPTVRGRLELGCSSRCLRRRIYIPALLAEGEDGGQRLPLVCGEEAPLSRVVYTLHRFVQLLTRPADDEAVALRRALQQPVERVPGFLEAGLFLPRRPFWPPANVTARLTLHPRQQVLFGRAQVHSDHVGLVVQVVAGLLEAALIERCFVSFCSSSTSRSIFLTVCANPPGRLRPNWLC
jgi:hypothetical protein